MASTDNANTPSASWSPTPPAEGRVSHHRGGARSNQLKLIKAIFSLGSTVEPLGHLTEQVTECENLARSAISPGGHSI